MLKDCAERQAWGVEDHQILPVVVWGPVLTCVYKYLFCVKKRNFHVVTVLPGSWYLAMSGKLLHRATTNVNRSIWSTIQSIHKKGLHWQKPLSKQESIFKSGASECKSRFCVISKAQFLCSTWFYTMQEQQANAWPGRNKYFLFVLKSQKLVAEYHPLFW